MSESSNIVVTTRHMLTEINNCYMITAVQDSSLVWYLLASLVSKYMSLIAQIIVDSKVLTWGGKYSTDNATESYQELRVWLMGFKDFDLHRWKVIFHKYSWDSMAAFIVSNGAVLEKNKPKHAATYT